MAVMTGTANGTAAPPPPLLPLVPLAVPPRAPGRGARMPTSPPPGVRLLPLAAVPRHDRPPAATEAPGAAWYSRWRAVDGGTVIRLTAALSVLGVAAIAAVVSYTHIYDLAVAHHESGTAARLLPVSVDGLIVSASMTLLDAARKQLDAPRVAYLMLWLGVGATVAANVAFGLPYGRVAAIVAAWPAVSFVGSVEMALTLARNQRRAGGDRGGRRPWRSWRQRKAATPEVPPAGDASASTTAASATTEAAPPARQDTAPPAAKPAPAGRRQARGKRQPPRSQPRPDGSKFAAAMTLLDENAAMSVTDLMAAGVSEGTARRAKREHVGT